MMTIAGSGVFFFTSWSFTALLRIYLLSPPKRSRGLKYPLLVKRLACMVMSGAASAQLLDILQPTNLSPEMISEVRAMAKISVVHLRNLHKLGFEVSYSDFSCRRSFEF